MSFQSYNLRTSLIRAFTLTFIGESFHFSVILIMIFNFLIKFVTIHLKNHMCNLKVSLWNALRDHAIMECIQVSHNAFLQFDFSVC